MEVVLDLSSGRKRLLEGIVFWKCVLDMCSERMCVLDVCPELVVLEVCPGRGF
jgi:hypothetical protein